LKKGGFIFGAEYGKGVASCRTATGWSAPAPYTVAGGSWGLQIGGEAVDLVMIVMNDKGMEHLLSSKFKLGADASVAAGPVGREAEGDTDWKLRAEVLTYSRARGIFAGVTVNGAAIAQDHDATRAFYGSDDSFRSILTGEVPTPSGSQPFLAAVSKFSAEAQSEKGK
jgi:lipid-binding SYLF domain-containing protein